MPERNPFPEGDVESWFKAPAEDGLVTHLGSSSKMEQFAGFVSTTVVSDLSQEGITLTVWDALQLMTALRVVHSWPSVRYSTEAIDREERIRKLAEQLEAELKSEDEWRIYWGDADPDVDDPEPKGSLEVAGLVEQLQTLQRSAEEREVWLRSAKQMAIEPGSNRAERPRTFYWLVLLAFWKHHLGRDIVTSTTQQNKGAGPLVRFIQIMSKGAMASDQITGTAIRAWVRRNAVKADELKSLFVF